MSIENNGINNDSLKNKKLTEEEKIKEEKKQIEFKITKEIISVELESEDKIFHLKELVEQGIITNETAHKIASGKEITNNEIKEIFEKIDEIEDIKNVDKYLPKELRITHEQYLKGVNDDIYRIILITKIDTALTILSNQINPDSITGLNLFSGFMAILDKNLIKIQENTIDIKNGLKKIDEKKYGKKIDNRTFFQKIVDFIKEIFN